MYQASVPRLPSPASPAVTAGTGTPVPPRAAGTGTGARDDAAPGAPEPVPGPAGRTGGGRPVRGPGGGGSPPQAGGESRQGVRAGRARTARPVTDRVRP